MGAGTNFRSSSNLRPAIKSTAFFTATTVLFPAKVTVHIIVMSACKKLVNSPSSCVEDCLEGLVLVHPGLQLIDGHNVVLRRDYAQLKTQRKVALLCGGGSGHEPAHAGYVGAGLLTGAVAGAVFASPGPASILAAIRAVGRDHPAGVLVVVKNYTGDRLNFGLAVERAKAEGMLVDMVFVDEDCALTSSDKTAGRRGLAGVVLVNKIAGCLAEEGHSLSEIVTTLRQAVRQMGTIGMSLSPCSVPGAGPSFQLGDQEMELGLGIHGEAGVKRVKLVSAREAVTLMLNHMTSSESSTHLDLDAGDCVALLVNNLGGTSILELHIVAKEAIHWLESRLITVELVYCGTYVTSLEMAGVSLTVLKLNDTYRRCLNAPTKAPAWSRPLLVGDHTTRTTNCKITCPDDLDEKQQQEQGCSLSESGSRVLYEVISYALEALGNCERQLNTLDTQSGDGDCGMTLKRGTEAVFGLIGTKSSPSPLMSQPHLLALAMARITEEAMGGSSGALYSLLLSAAAGPLKTGCDPHHWLAALQAGVQAVSKYGGAEPGDRTMLDALQPACESLQQSLSKEGSLVDAFTDAAAAAERGAKATVGMSARAGRASYVNPEHLKHADPGAHAVGIWLRAASEAFKLAAMLDNTASLQQSS